MTDSRSVLYAYGLDEVLMNPTSAKSCDWDWASDESSDGLKSGTEPKDLEAGRV